MDKALLDEPKLRESSVHNLLSVIRRLGIEENEQTHFLTNFLGVSPRTVKRRLEGESPSKGELLKLEMLASVNDLAVRMFGDQQQAREWLGTPLPTFGNKTALEMLESVQGYEKVKSTIIGQAYGMF
jgi:putative toxin-antitoxin system antitoxin component (TIGR02293 family)